MARDRCTPWTSRPTEAATYGDWLSGFPWDWYVTQTFPDVVGPESAARLHRKWTRALEDYLGHSVRQARALEYQKRGVIHYHALLYGVRPDTRRKDWEGAWRELARGFAAIYPYNPELGAAHYVGKYVAKGGEIDLIGPWWRVRERRDDAPATRGGVSDERTRPGRG